MLAENEKVRWVPEHLKHGRFKHIIEGAPDWNISRSRFWASPLPIWKNVRGDIKIVGSLEELQKYTGGKLPQNEVGEVDVHRPWIDELAFVDERGEKYTRVPEVVDCWVESAAMPYATAVGFPADFIAEYIAQTRTWFYYLHTLGVLLKGRSAFKAVVSTGTILAVDGEKISKSKGNYTDPMELMDQYGADALRFYLMGSVVMQGEDLAFSDEGVREAHNRVVGILRNCLSFFALYKDEYEWKTKGGESPHILDRWIFARLAACTKEMTEAMDAYDLPRVCREVRAFVEDYSTWYIRRSRERVKGENFEDKQHCLAAQRKVLLTLSKFIAPLMPFLAEEIYRAVGGEKESVHLESWEDAQVKKDDARIIEEMEKVRYIVSLALEQRAKANIKIRQPLSKLLITNDSLHTRSGLLALVRDEVNVKEVVFQKSLAQEVALDTFITPELKEEGAYRELVRAVQDLRKARGLTIADRVELSIDTDAAGRAFVEKYVAQLTKAALLSGVRFAPVKNGEKVTIGALSLCIDCTTRPR
jgi:isoleucyl-tRNA synthetase